MIAAYNFKLGTDRYGEGELCVQAESFGEAKDAAEQMLVGSKQTLGELVKVVDARLMVNNTNVIERQLHVNTHVTHSGEITEYKGKANPTTNPDRKQLSSGE